MITFGLSAPVVSPLSGEPTIGDIEVRSVVMDLENSQLVVFVGVPYGGPGGGRQLKIPLTALQVTNFTAAIKNAVAAAYNTTLV